MTRRLTVGDWLAVFLFCLALGLYALAFVFVLVVGHAVPILIVGWGLLMYCFPRYVAGVWGVLRRLHFRVAS